MTKDNVVHLPYGGKSDPNSGFAGSDTSEERARTDDRTGITGSRQAEARRLLRRSGRTGMTWRELATETGWHHGQASGTLSGLHKAGIIARLVEPRLDAEGRSTRCKVYVLPEHVNGRETEPQGQTVKTLLFVDAMSLLREVITNPGAMSREWTGQAMEVVRQYDAIYKPNE